MSETPEHMDWDAWDQFDPMDEYERRRNPYGMNRGQHQNQQRSLWSRLQEHGRAVGDHFNRNKWAYAAAAPFLVGGIGGGIYASKRIKDKRDEERQ
ncbi:MAG: hypothetical protein P0S93_02650 [Candidatus Neptunochlamydia sp.]|nr:hypothetical protein [Candidatus Neptunochlamydia sp.]